MHNLLVEWMKAENRLAVSSLEGIQGAATHWAEEAYRKQKN
jgi:hypothetical protein